jgi:hypothetical protein
MKIYIMVALVCSVALLSPGCLAPGATPLQRTVQSEEMFTAVMRSLNSADAAGLISQDQKPAIRASKDAAASALFLMQESAQSGSDLSFREAVTKFNDAVDDLIRRRNAATRQAPATRRAA